jgi:uncharacterized protein YjeT (DUF2065 family)
MTTFGIIFFAIGIILILLGVSLITYSACRKKPTVATDTTDGNLLSIILDFVFNVLDLIFKNMPKDQMSTAGIVLVIVGIGLALLPFVVPGL